MEEGGRVIKRVIACCARECVREMGGREVMRKGGGGEVSEVSVECVSGRRKRKGKKVRGRAGGDCEEAAK